MRVVCSFVGGWGHAEPLLPLAALAQRHGHRVSFAGQSAVRDRLVRLGHEVDVVGPDTLGTTPQALVPVDRDAEREVMRDHFVAGFGRARAAALGALFDREHVGLVVCDEVDVGAVVAAEQRGIPSVTVDVIAAGLLTAPAVVGSAWDELRRDHGLAPDPQCVRLGGAVAVAPLPRSFRSPAATTHSTPNDPTPEGKKPWVKKPAAEGKTPWTPRSDAEAAPAAAGDKPWKGKPKGGDRPWAAKDARGKPAAPRAPYKAKGPR